MQKFIAHPESESQVLEIADYIGSTSGLLNYVQVILLLSLL